MDRQSLNLELIGVMLPAAIAVPGNTEQLPSTLQAQARAAVLVTLEHQLRDGHLLGSVPSPELLC
jgi:hypothetical protein